jgi:hypothetical protein
MESPVARTSLLGIALLAALSVAGCSAGEDEGAAEQAAETQLAAMRARNDSIRQARQAADTMATDSAGQSTLAATTPATTDSVRADSIVRAEVEASLADSIQKAREIEVMRETFAYGGGSRDPFASLINTSKLGPEIADLDLVGVYQNLRTPSNNLVILREKMTGKRHKLRTGDQVGRARLVQIRPREAVFMISDFGFDRQETLSLRKQEVETP